MFEHLGVNINSGYRGIDRGRPQVKQAGSAGADQNDPSLDVILRNLPGQPFPGGNIPRLVVVAEFEKNPAGTIGRYCDIADADMVQASGLPKGGFAIG